MYIYIFTKISFAVYSLYLYNISGYSYIAKRNVVYTVVNAHTKYTLIPYKKVITDNFKMR